MRDDIKIPWREQLIWIALFVLVFAIVDQLFPRKSLEDKDYIDAIVGEASDQTPDTMVCVAHALRNRGNLRGVYGYHAKHNKKESLQTWHNAAVAWELSAQEPDNVKGAKNWGTDEDLTENNPDVVIKKQCGDFYFY